MLYIWLREIRRTLKIRGREAPSMKALVEMSVDSYFFTKVQEKSKQSEKYLLPMHLKSIFWRNLLFRFKKIVTINIARGTTDPEIDSVTWIELGNNMAPLTLVANLATRWHQLR